MTTIRNTIVQKIAGTDDCMTSWKYGLISLMGSLALKKVDALKDEMFLPCEFHLTGSGCSESTDSGLAIMVIILAITTSTVNNIPKNRLSFMIVNIQKHLCFDVYIVLLVFALFL